MSDPVKTWDRAKPFMRINNDAFRPTTPADGNGVDCGCQLPSQYPNRVDEFEKAFKNYKPDSFQRLIQRLHKVSSGAKVGLTAAGAILAGVAGIAAAAAVAGLIDDILGFTEDAIKELLHNIGLKLTEQAIRYLPHWVPVIKGASNEQVGADQTVEVEGRAKRSYMDPVDVPFRQWHLWFNWNILLDPDPGYENVLTRGGSPPIQLPALNQDTLRPIAPDETGLHALEVQWDTGALWDASMRATIDNDTGFKDHLDNITNYDGPMFIYDWVWPMTNSHVWVAGRWVYDCSRIAEADRADGPLMWTMVNPCKALATARWAAFQFEENDFAVPAIQFMFFACRRGGYIDYETIRDQDYEFIVDLPLLEMEPRAPLPVGHTGNFPHNTIVLRPRLLMDVDQKPFGLADSAAIEPIVTPIRPDDPQLPPTQVKVRVPLTSLPADAQACGFILSLGWFDPNNQLATKVKVVTAKFTGASGLHTARNAAISTLRHNLNQHEPAKALTDKILEQANGLQVAGLNLGNTPLAGPVKKLVQKLVDEVMDFLEGIAPGHSEQWLFRMGVNGQWKGYYRDYVPYIEPTNPPTTIPFDTHRVPVFDLLLSDEDLLAHEVNGVSWGPVGSFMRFPPGSRLLQVNGHAPTWAEIVKPDDDPATAQQRRLEMAIEYAIRLLHLGPEGMGLATDNQPLGFLDPLSYGNTGPAFPEVEGARNPLDLKRAGNLVASGILEAPLLALALSPERILVEAADIDGGRNKDYDIEYDVLIQSQHTKKK